MRIIAVFACLLIVACTKANPEACCVTEEQCAVAGVDGLRPCDVGQACDPAANVCVASECDTAVDCGPAAPVCSLGLCVTGCRVDDDCADVAGKPFCAADNVCVGCETSEQCPAEAAICDVGTRACRGCEADDQCASGVCVEADGLCADDASIVHVSSVGVDTGTCTKVAPCASIAFAMQFVTATRNVVHLEGDSTDDVSTISISRPVIIDGTGTRFVVPAAGPAFALVATNGAFSTTMEGLRFLGSGQPRAVVTVGMSKSLTLYKVELENANVDVTNGSLDIRRSICNRSGIVCTSGTLTATENRFAVGGLSASNCQTQIARNEFSATANAAIEADGGLLTVTNNVFTLSSEFIDLIRAGANAPGSLIAFNSIANATTVTQSPVAITCDASVKVSSNIIAYNSTNPIGGAGCVAQFSLFDLQGAADATGNISADPLTFFVDRSAGDLHLAPGSPASNGGEPGLVTSDFEGTSRSATPDIGAFEAP